MKLILGLLLSFSGFAYADGENSYHIIQLLQNPRMVALEKKMAERQLDLLRVSDTGAHYRCACTDFVVVFGNMRTREKEVVKLELSQGTVVFEGENAEEIRRKEMEERPANVK